MDGTETRQELEAAQVFDYLFVRGGGLPLGLLKERMNIKGLEALLAASDWFRVSGDAVRYVDIRYQSGNFPINQ